MAMGANAEHVERMYAAFGRGDIPAVIAGLAGDVDWSSPATLPQGGTFSGSAGALKFFEGLGAAWSQLDLDLERVGEIGSDLVVGIMRGNGTLRSGNPRSYGAVHVF